MRTFILPADAIRRVAVLASTESTRPILNNVLVEASGLMVATDGKVMGVYKLPAAIADVPGCTKETDAHTCPDTDVQIPAGELLKVAKVAKCVAVRVASNNVDKLQVEALDHYGRSLRAVLLDIPDDSAIRGGVSTYPTWRNVLPKGDSGPIPSITLDPALVAKFATKDGGPCYFTFSGDDTKAVMVQSSKAPAFFGLLMPYSNKAKPEPKPAWLYGEPAKPEPVPPVQVNRETAYGATVQLSRSVNVF